ncbi:DUF5989 family protein [Fidelibacter multiformis]|jgi:hypothetical protein|uniref:DUF5989 family protein n=1 Tax=Fidelibacter multiformis TaxID=3377529 RepID=UPI0037DD86C5
MGKWIIIKEFFQYARENKRYLILPIVMILLLLGVIIIFSQGSALAPFIYALF